jgi:hypothetical protein
MEDHLELFTRLDRVHCLRRQQEQKQQDEDMQHDTLQVTAA